HCGAQPVASCERELEILRAKERTWKSELETLKRKIIAELSNELRDKDNALNALKQANRRLLDRLREKETRAESLGIQRDELQRKVAHYQSRIEVMKAEIKTLADEVEKVNQQQPAYELRIQQMELLLQNNEYTINSLNLRLEEEQGARRSLEKDHEELLRRIREHERTLDLSRVKEDSWRTRIDEERSKTNAQKDEIDRLQDKVSALEEDKLKLGKSAEKGSEQLTRAGIALKERDELISVLQADKRRQSRRIDELIQIKEELKAQGEADVRRLETIKGQTDELSLEKARLQRLLEDKENALSRLRSKSSAQDALVSEQKLALSGKQEQIEGLLDEKLQLKVQISEDASRIRDLRREITGLAALIDEKDKTITRLTRVSSRRQEERRAFPEKSRELHTEQAVVQEGIAESVKRDQPSGRRSRLAQTLADNEKITRRLLDELEDYRQKLAGMQKTNAQAEQEKESFARKYRMLLKEYRMFRKKLHSFSRKLARVSLLKERLLKENAVLHYNLGVFHLQRLEHMEAVREFGKALELNPQDAASHYNLGLIYAEYLDNKSKAINHFKRYLMIDPQDKDADRARKYILTWEMWQEEKVTAK
ncbi:MAG: tetratricopeptide repeat protein, partial [Candidatus Omnitrophica bacterium]|nr:tetratricopeptide repeat protein [Candidatus Omnitrophota bacterium]